MTESSPNVEMKSSLRHLPGDRWVFDQSVTSIFEDMLCRSIPHLDVMRSLVVQLARRFVQPRTDIVDLGCSKGDAMAPLVDLYHHQNRFVGVEVAAPMLTACRTRFRSMIERGIVDIRDDDLRTTFPDVNASVTLCVLTLQFTPIEHRSRILRDIFQCTRPGGAFLFVEKVLGNDAASDESLVALYHAHKRSMGYSQEEIDRKRLALEGVLVPVTSRWNEQLLRDAGFRSVECFWRFLNFSGWIAMRD